MQQRWSHCPRCNPSTSVLPLPSCRSCSPRRTSSSTLQSWRWGSTTCTAWESSTGISNRRSTCGKAEAGKPMLPLSPGPGASRAERCPRPGRWKVAVPVDKAPAPHSSSEGQERGGGSMCVPTCLSRNPWHSLGSSFKQLRAFRGKRDQAGPLQRCTAAAWLILTRGSEVGQPVWGICSV